MTPARLRGFFIYIGYMKKILTLALSLFLASASALAGSEPITLTTPTGQINGTLLTPKAGKATPVVLLLSGSGPTDRDGNQPMMMNNSLKLVAEGLEKNGIASVRFDKRGVGESAKALTAEKDIRFDNYIDDAKAWVALLKNDARFSHVFIAGHSEGALIGLIAAENNPSVSGYISIAGMGRPFGDLIKEQLETQPKEIKQEVYRILDKLEEGTQVENVNPELYALFRPDVQPYLISLMRYNPSKEIAQLKIPVLIVQGTTDLQVKLADAEVLSASNSTAKKVIVENMNHVLKDCTDTTQMAQMTTYTNPMTPLNKELMKSIKDFVKDNSK